MRTAHSVLRLVFLLSSLAQDALRFLLLGTRSGAAIKAENMFLRKQLAQAPVLMLNGRFDFIFPTASSQEPMLRLLGTPTRDKRRVVYDTGHDIPRSEMIKETLNWLDNYLGPVK